MMTLQEEFMDFFKSNGGFGSVSGSKWQQHINQDRFRQTEVYMTEDQILDVEKNEKNTDAKLAWAEEQGEGTSTPGHGKG